jgi:hypothetical protein
MTKNKLNLIIWVVVITVTACSNGGADNINKNRIVSTNLSRNIQNTDSVPTDSITLWKNKLAKTYSIAISDYLDAENKKDKTNFDTLFIGKQVEFPEIELPKEINGAKIILLNPEEIIRSKQLYCKTSPYINLIGSVEKDKAEFIFVTFYPEFQHQYDCYLNYTYNSKNGGFDLLEIRIEILILNKDGKANHFAIYENGKYIGNKPIDNKNK